MTQKVHITIRKGDSVSTILYQEGIMIDVDQAGEMLSITILDALKVDID